MRTSRRRLSPSRPSRRGTAGRPALVRPLATRAPAKINLSLHVLGRRADGYHELESLVAFAGVGDTLSLTPDEPLSLTMEGPTAPRAGPLDNNLVLKGARHLVQRRHGLRLGAFRLVKRLPVAAGIGGGSSDAAAALRLLARLNGLSLDDPAVLDAARATGADVPVCLAARARFMRGVGERLGPPLKLPRMFAVLVNPAVPVETAQVFGALGLSPGAPPLTRMGPTFWKNSRGRGTTSSRPRARSRPLSAMPWRYSAQTRSVASPGCRARGRRCSASSTTATPARSRPRRSSVRSRAGG
jgi:hypothetical protein